MPITFASLNLVIQATNDTIYAYLDIADENYSIKDQVADVRNLYETLEIPNKVPDGTFPFPENQRSPEMGISIEFRYATILLDLKGIEVVLPGTCHLGIKTQMSTRCETYLSR